MDAILPFVPLGIMMIVIPAVYGLIVIFSARLLRSNEITWKKGFVFGIIIIFLGLFLRLVANKLNYSLPHFLGIIFGLIFNLSIGGWFFRERGKNAEGELLGWGGAIKLTGLSYVIFIGLGEFVILASKIAFSAIMP